MAPDPISPQSEQNLIGPDPDEEPRHTLLRVVATSRPVGEVASLVNLLNQTGETPRPGDEALRLAAVSRSVDEVHDLVALLKEPPHTADEADTALCAAATCRPIEEVAELVATFAPDDAEWRQPEAVASATIATVDTGKDGDSASFPVSGPDIAEATASGDEAGAAPRRHPASSLRFAWRRLAAALALLVIGAIHLPVDIAGLRSGDLAAGVATAIAVTCLVLACLLVIQDTVWVWAASAMAAVATVAVHSVAAGFDFAHLLQDSLGHAFVGATSLALVCAVVAAVLAGSALMRSQKSQAVANDA